MRRLHRMVDSICLATDSGFSFALAGATSELTLFYFSANRASSAQRVGYGPSNNLIDLIATRNPEKVYARAVPVEVEVSALDHASCAIWIKKTSTFSTDVASAWIHYSVRSRVSQTSAKPSALLIAGWIQQGHKSWLRTSQVVQPCINIEDDLSKLRRPPGCFFSACHEPFMVMDGFKKRHLEGIANIKHAEGTIAKPAGSINARVRERRHQVAGARTAHPMFRRHKIQLADRLHEPRIGFLLRGNNERPVGGVRYVLE